MGNESQRLNRVLRVLEPVAQEAGASLADLVVLAGRAEVKSAVQSAGFSIEVSLSPVCKRWTLIGLIPR